MSSFERRDAVFDSPCRARSLLTVRAAISSAVSSPSPRSRSDSFTCSYWRPRLLPFVTPRGGISSSLVALPASVCGMLASRGYPARSARKRRQASSSGTQSRPSERFDDRAHLAELDELDDAPAGVRRREHEDDVRADL